MSKTVDSRVVEMRFDNSQFESNVRTSMSTLERLKQSLNLTKSAKGLESVSAAAKKVDFSGMNSGIDSVNTRFSALQVMGVTALANITNSAVNAGKKIVSALTFEPVMTGFQEYETQINAVQTILANTQKEGTNVQIVNKALDELNAYADKTIYNFTEMTRNIGTFTAAGVKLQTSVDAIQGIANLAAVSGSTSQQASTAMYQLSQALATGTVKLMDWNSVVNAGMGGAVFQDALKETSRLLGTGVDAAIEANGSFRESLHTGWLTAEVLTETLKKFTTSGATEYVAEYTGLSEKAVQAALESAEAQYGEAEAIDKAAEALAKKSGKSKDEIKNALQFAKTAEDAATKVKTFSQLWDTMKEAVQSGWAQTWRLVIGDFEEAGKLLTGVSDFFNGIISKMNDARNDLLESALGKSFSGMAKKMNELLEPAKKAADTVKDVGDSIADLGDIVDDVILGKFGNGQERFDALTKAGQNWMEVQNQVNEKLGDSHRYTKEQIAAQDKLISKQKEATKETAKTGEETKKLTDEQKKRIVQLAKMSDEELKSLGYTEKQIAAFQELRDTADQLGLPLDTFIMKMDEINGRWLLWNSFANIGTSLTKVFGAIGKAWGDVFDPIKPEQIFDAIAAIHRFTASLIMNKDTAEDLRNTFRGLFAVLDLVTSVAGGGIKLAFKALSTVLGAFDLNILSVTGSIGNAIYNFKEWLFEQNALAKGLDKLVSKLPEAVKHFRQWFSAFKETAAVEKFVEAIQSIQNAFDDLFSGKIDVSELARSLGENLANALKSIPEIVTEIGKDVIAGFQNGIEDGVSGSVIGKIVNFCTEFLAAFAEALGVQSPSWKTYEIAVDTVQGFINGVKAMAGKALDSVKELGNKIIDFFKDISWDKMFAAGVTISLVWFVKQIATAVSGIADGIGGLGDIFENTADVLKSFSKVLKGLSWDLKAKAIQKMAISLGILVAAIVVLSYIDTAKMWNAVAVIAALSGILVALAFAMDKMSQASVNIGKSGASIEGLKSGLIQIGIALLLLAATVKLVGSMDIDQAIQGFIGLAGLATGMLAFLAICGGISRYSKNLDKFGSTLLKMSVAMFLMVQVIKSISKLDPGDIIVGVAVMEAFILLFAQMAIANRIAGGNATKFGGTLMKMSIAMLLMVGVMKMVSAMDPADVVVGVAVMEAFVLLFAQMAIVNRIAGSNAAKFGGTLVKMAISMLLMAGVVKIISTMNPNDVLKGVLVMQAFVLLIAEMLLVAKLGNNTSKIAGNLLAMSVAIGILAAVSIALSLIDIAGLAKGIVAVGLLGGVMTAMIWATRGANDVKGSLMAMSLAIAVMAAAVVALSFIDGSKLAGATVAISILMGMFGLMAKMAGNVTSSIKSMAIMLIAVGMLAAVIYILSGLEIGSTLEISTSLSLLMMSLAASMKLISTAGTSAMSAMPAMFAMTGILAIVATIIGVLAALKVGSTIEIAASLSLLLLSLSASMAIISATGAAALSAMPAALAMSGILATIATILGVLVKMDVGPTLETAKSLSMLLLSLSTACVIMAGAAAIATVAAAGLVPLMTLMVGMGVLMAAIAGLVTFVPDLENFLSKALPILKLIGQGIGEFLGGIIGGIGEGITGSLPQMGQDIADFMSALAKASENASGIQSGSFDGVKDLISALGQIALTSVGTSIADMFTGLLGGESSMEKFKTDGVAFFEAMKEISKAATGITIDEASMQAAITAGKGLTEIAGAIPKSGGFLQDIVGEADLEKFGNMCVAFGSAIKKMSANLTGENGATLINEEAINSAVKAGNGMSKVANAIPKSDGFLQDIVGEADLLKFGNMCVAFGSAIRTMSQILTGENGATLINEEAINSAVKAGKGMSKLADAIPKSDGFLQDVVGEQDLATFGSTCKAFGEAIKTMSQSLTGGDGGTLINEEAIQSVVKAGRMVVTLQEALPEEGWFDGKMNLSEFSNYIRDFALAMSSFSTQTANINADGINVAITAANRIKTLINSLVGLDTSGVAAFTGIGTGGFGADGAVSDIGKAIASYSNSVAGIDTGVVNTSVSAALRLKTLIAGLAGLDASGIENFKIGSVGTQMKNYAAKVAGIDTGVVSSSISSANRLKTFIAGLSGLDSSGISNFKVGSIGSTLKSYASSVTGMNTSAVSSSISVATRLKNFIASLSGFDGGGVSSYVSAINKLGTVSVAGIVKSFSGASTKMLSAGSNLIESVVKGMRSKQSSLTSTVNSLVNTMQKAFTSKASSFQTAGSMLMTKLVTGIKSKSTQVSATMKSAVSSAASSIRGSYSSFYSAGSYLGSGLVSGINSKKSAAYDAGYALGQAAVRGEKDGQASNSPSKLTIQAGKWLGEGLIIGIKKMGSKVYNAGHSLGDSAASSMSTSISRIADAINTDIDAQPTIRPVLDLDDIKSGAGMINGMLSQNASVGVNANLNAISAMMNQNGHQTGMDDVVYAINKLRKDLGNVGNTSYNINGVTYDDGSNITDAVKTIVRAARVERRI